MATVKKGRHNMLKPMLRKEVVSGAERTKHSTALYPSEIDTFERLKNLRASLHATRWRRPKQLN